MIHLLPLPEFEDFLLRAPEGAILVEVETPGEFPSVGLFWAEETFIRSWRSFLPGPLCSELSCSLVKSIRGWHGRGLGTLSTGCVCGISPLCHSRKCTLVSSVSRPEEKTNILFGGLPLPLFRRVRACRAATLMKQVGAACSVGMIFEGHDT